MVRLLDVHRGILFTTNLKVLYSTLVHHDHLTRLNESQVAARYLSGRIKKHIMFARNPYDRLVSAWTDKFASHPNRLGGAGFGRWQDIQYLYLRRLGVSREAPDTVIQSELLGVGFDKFVRYLPDVYLRDGHLVPQWMAKSIRLRGRWAVLPLRIDRVIRIEEMDRAKILAELGLDLNGNHHNRTDHPPAAHLFTPELQAIVDVLYKQDFREFGYARL
jgi:hypothetical protein